MERWLCIFEMHEEADPVALAQSRLLPDLLPQEYTATRARRAVNLKVIRTNDVALWSFVMLPEGPLVSRAPAPFRSTDSWSIVVIRSFTRPLQVMAVNAARSDPPTPRARARVRRSDGNKSGRRARRRRGSGDGNARNREVRSSGCASSWDSPPRRLRSTRRQTRRRRRVMGDMLSPRGGSLRPPRPEPWRRQRRQRLGRARERPPPGSLQERRCAPWRCRRAPRCRLGVGRWPRRRRPQRPPSPRGRGSGDSPP
jgi:hypothetical protein